MELWTHGETGLDATKNKVPTASMELSPLLSQGGGGGRFQG